MSSYIEVQKMCQNCGNEFTARTTVTRFCSKKCSAAMQKRKLRNEKIAASDEETQRIKNQPIEELQSRQFLTVTQVSKLIGCSRQNVYKLINAGRLRATNILQNKTIVQRSDLDRLFKQPSIVTPQKEIPPELMKFDISECYTVGEIQNKYGISETFLYHLTKRNNVPKIKYGKFVFVPKTVIDNLLSSFKNTKDNGDKS